MILDPYRTLDTFLNIKDLYLSNNEVHLSLVLDLHGLAIDWDPLLDLQIDCLNQMSTVNQNASIPEQQEVDTQVLM